MTIDVSHHQGFINWEKAKEEVREAFIKATEGVSLLDSKFFINSLNAKGAGIKVGYYHFASLNKKNVKVDAAQEANWFLRAIEAAPAPDLPLVLDIETNVAKIDKQSVLVYIQTFFATLKLHGYHNYMLYSGTHFLNDNLPIKHPLGAIPVWIADYTPPHYVPRGWQRIKLLQYTEKGKVLGIRGNVDINKYIL